MELTQNKTDAFEKSWACRQSTVKQLITAIYWFMLDLGALFFFFLCGIKLFIIST